MTKTTMRPVRPGYATATTVRAGRDAWHGYLVLSPIPDGALMEVTPRDSKADPVLLRLTDQQRKDLIVALGGDVHSPRADRAAADQLIAERAD